MARLYADENFPQPVMMELHRLEHDVRSTQEAGRAGQKISDESVPADAIAENRTVLTHNRKDFIYLHSVQLNHAGIIVCTADLDFTGLASRIDEAIKSQIQLAGQLIRVSRPASSKRNR